MQINIQGHNVELSAPLRTYAVKKMGKLQEFYRNIQKLAITLDVRANDDLKRTNVAEVSIWASGKKVIRASEAGESMYSAIDLVFEELKKQLIKHKDMHIKEARREGEKFKEISRTAKPLIPSGKMAQSIAKLKRFDINTMTAEEAAAEKKMLGHDFFMFRNADTGELNVIHEGKTLSPSDVKALSEEDAASELKKQDSGFLPFLNPETNELNVLYKRKSGNLGLIEPAL